MEAILGARIKHEEWTRQIVRDRLATTLHTHGVTPEHVIELITTQDAPRHLPAHLKEIISSQLDVDRMDYLCRDAHFSGVAVGQIDVHYLVRCLRVIRHGSQQTLGVTAKGVACYEAFAFARHVMNRSVYFHKQVATFECMMEECIRLLVMDSSNKYLPEFFLKLREQLTRSGVTDALEGGQSKGTDGPSKGLSVSEYLDSYLALTEDQIWATLSERTAGNSPLSVLSQRLLERRPVYSHRIAAGKHALLKNELKQGGFTREQYRIRSMPSSLYEQDSGEQVFVQEDGSKHSAHISEKSSLVDALRDKPETDAILVIFDEDARTRIEEAARQANCLASFSDRRSNRPPGPPLAKTAPQELERPATEGSVSERH